ncbi:uncharacterized protein LOC132063811 [Lycium ferocissimum]|uniref:uncharacterized protein LOC132063811 n=1 Tax=Lycium ferocissimum TaxID=112874 RepID=UPI002814D7E8|nr:uncharacterized protein LOC132063811 [Lycium ferocissimum]XP_059312521.1 uncharacterized protein LOC132063811 [Lycium ferocissimum]
MGESAAIKGMVQEEHLVDTEEDENSRALFLKELNLVLILSFLSLSSEELDFEAKEINENVKVQQQQKVVSHLRCRKRGGINQYNTVEPEIQRSSTKFRDCRHCRRM